MGLTVNLCALSVSMSLESMKYMLTFCQIQSLLHYPVCGFRVKERKKMYGSELSG